MGAQIGAPRAQSSPLAPEADTVFTWKDDYIQRASDALRAGSVRLDGLAGFGASDLIPISLYMEPKFTPLRNAIPRQAAHGKPTEYRPISNYGFSPCIVPDARFEGGLRLTEVSLVPAENALFGPIQFADPAIEPYVQRTADQLRRFMTGQEDNALRGSDSTNRIEVVCQPAIYDPSNPDHWRAYVRQLRQAGHSPEKIAKWCPALAWSQIVEVLG